MKKLLITGLLCAALAGCTLEILNKPQDSVDQESINDVPLVAATNADQYKIIVYYPKCEAALMFKNEGSSNYKEVRRELIELGAYDTQTPLKDCRIYRKLTNVTWNDINFYIADADRVDYSRTRAMYISSRGDQNDNIFAIHNFPHKYLGENELRFRPKIGGFGSWGCVGTDDWINEWFEAVKEGTRVEFVRDLVDIDGDRITFYDDYYNRIQDPSEAAMQSIKEKLDLRHRKIDPSKIREALEMAANSRGYVTGIDEILVEGGR